MAALLLALALWAFGLVRDVRSLRANGRSLLIELRGSPHDVGGTLARLRGDVGRLRRKLALAPALGWLPRVGSTLREAPALLEAGESLLESGATLWEALGAPALTAWQGDDPAAALAVLVEGVESQRERLRPAVDQAQDALERVAAIDAEQLLPRLGEPLAQAQSALPLGRAGLDALLLLPNALAEDGAWLILAQNSDELRATGGFISSIGELTIADGRPALGAFADSYAVENWSVAHPDPPEALRQYMGIDLWTVRDANWWPHFPASAQAVSELYTLNQDTPVRGVVAVDFYGAARIVEALTPLELGSGERLAPGEVLEALRASWSMPAENLIGPPVVVTATQALSALDIAVVMNNRPGTAWIDTVRVAVAGTEASLLVNGDMETDADGDGLPDHWTSQGLLAPDALDDAKAYTGERALRLEGASGLQKRLAQRVTLDAPAGTVLELSGLAATDGVDVKGGAFALQLVLHFADGTQQRVSAPFAPYTHDWASAGAVQALARWFQHRKDIVDRVWQAAAVKLAAAESVRWGALLDELRACLDERHIQIYAQDGEIQALVARYGWAGALSEDGHDYVLVVDSNVGYNKVSPNVEQAMAYRIDLAEGLATLQLTYRNRSEAMASGCDKFQQYTPDYDALAHGCYWDYVRVYAPAGSTLLEAHGGDEPAAVHAEQGRAVFTTALVLAPGEQRMLEFVYRLPASVLGPEDYALTWQKQAGTVGLPVSVTLTGASDLADRGSAVQPVRRDDGGLEYQGELRKDLELVVGYR
ncbi:MAG: DUF4012 domain-containing protein [Chloroflexi bacterium]|nr:DUF4012 domain-containing protein [Chloroflexota bacterium]